MSEVDETPKQETLPLEDKGSSATLSVLEKTNAELREQNQRLKSEKDAAERDAKTKRAEKDGKLKEELTTTAAQLTKERESREKLEKALRARVDRNMAKLTDDQRAEIELVKDDIPLDKLEALVDMRLGAKVVEAAAEDKDSGDKVKKKLPPVPGVPNSDTRPVVGHEIHSETKSVLKRVFAEDRVYEVGKEIGVDSVGKFGWGRSDDEELNKANFMGLLRKARAIPKGGVSDDAMADRVLKK